MSSEWKLEHDRYGIVMDLRSNWSSELLADIRENNVTGIHLNDARGWPGDNLEFLRSLRHILLSVYLTSYAVEDLEPLHDLTKLRLISVMSETNTSISFHCFPNLEKVAFEWWSGLRSLYDHRGVRHVFLNCWTDGVDLTPFSEMTQLTVLRIYSPRPMTSLRGIAKLRNLKWLSIAIAPKLTSLEGIEHLQNLEFLQIASCQRISDIEPISELRNLRRLDINNCGKVASLWPIRNNKNLEWLRFIENTNIVDGDLRVIDELTKLKSANFQQRRHYTHTAKDVPKSLGGWEPEDW